MHNVEDELQGAIHSRHVAHKVRNARISCFLTQDFSDPPQDFSDPPQDAKSLMRKWFRMLSLCHRQRPERPGSLGKIGQQNALNRECSIYSGIILNIKC